MHARAPDGYEIRLAREGDVAALPGIEREAAKLFAPWGLDVLFASATTPLDVFGEARDSGHLLVATDADETVVGFAMLSRVDWHAHLDEIDVLPDHGGKGIGRALVDASLDQARTEGRGRMTLATMREIPFNGPWYLRLGFRELEERELGPGLRTVFQRELAGGYPMEGRVILGLDL